MNPIEQVLHYQYLQHALLGGVLVAVVCGVLGVFLVLRGLSLLGDGLAHVSFGGVALGLTVSFYPTYVALAFTIAGALLIHLLRTRGIVRGDTAIGILFTTGLAFGRVLLSRGSFNVNVDSLLFGQLLGVPESDLPVVLVVGVGLLVLLGLFRKEFFYMTYSEPGAQVAGLPVQPLNALFMALTATAIVVASKMVGVLLVSALLIMPAAASLQLARSFNKAILFSVVFGLASVAAGFWFSLGPGHFPTGASIALCSSALFAAAALARPLLRRAPSA
ncbi:MAG: metal ABC transporter permease [bacterium]